MRANEETSEAQEDRSTRMPQVRRRHQGGRLAMVSASKAGPIEALVELGEVDERASRESPLRFLRALPRKPMRLRTRRATGVRSAVRAVRIGSRG